MIELSVIIPVYNVEKYIADCIESVLKYQGEEIEVIAVVDGSPDNSEQVLRKYSENDSRLHIVTQENMGVSEARNNGISKATGRYLTFLDADDWLNTACLEQLVNELKHSSENNQLYLLDYVNVMDENEKRDELGLMELPSIEEIRQLALTTSKINHCTKKAFLTHIIKDNKILFPKGIKIGEDIIFMLDYLEHITSVKYMSIPFYYYRDNELSAMNTINVTRFMDMEHAYKRRIRFCKENGLDGLEKEINIYYRRAVYIYLKQIQTMNSGIKDKISLLGKVINIEHIYEIVMTDDVCDKKHWKYKIVNAVKRKNILYLWYILRGITMQQIKQ